MTTAQTKHSGTQVSHHDIGGRLYSNGAGPVIVLFNQWRSGASSLFSRHLAKLLQADGFGSILFIDRVASGGASRNTLSREEKRRIKQAGDQLFAADYYAAICHILIASSLPKKFYIGGSSIGAPAVLFTVLEAANKPVCSIIGAALIEPGGMHQHGIGKRHHLQTSHALAKHALAYRHRLQRGWWTPMDKEQYFAKGPPTEYRARFSAGETVKNILTQAIQNPKIPSLHVTFAHSSHAHTAALPGELQRVAVPPHIIRTIPGSHDHACQPHTLHQQYAALLASSSPQPTVVE